MWRQMMEPQVLLTGKSLLLSVSGYASKLGKVKICVSELPHVLLCVALLHARVLHGKKLGISHPKFCEPCVQSLHHF